MKKLFKVLFLILTISALNTTQVWGFDAAEDAKADEKASEEGKKALETEKDRLMDERNKKNAAFKPESDLDLKIQLAKKSEEEKNQAALEKSLEKYEKSQQEKSEKASKKSGIKNDTRLLQETTYAATNRGGIYKSNAEWEKEQKEDIVQINGGVVSAAQGFANAAGSPRARAVAQGTGGIISGIAAGYNTYHHYQLADVYDTLEQKNEDLQDKNMAKKNELEQKLTTTTDKETQTKLQADIAILDTEIKKQSKASWNYQTKAYGEYAKAALGLGASGTMMYTAYQNYKIAGDLSTGAEGGNVNPDPDSKLPSQPFQPTKDGFEREPGSENGSSVDPSSSSGSKGSGSNIPSPALGSGSGFASGFGSKSDSDSSKKETADKKKYSSDQKFPSSGGGGSDSSPLVSLNVGDSGFDINKFMPDWLKSSQEEGFLLRKINSQEEKEDTMILGKNSPSLFTRITKAYQKKSHELKEEVF